MHNGHGIRLQGAGAAARPRSKVLWMALCVAALVGGGWWVGQRGRRATSNNDTAAPTARDARRTAARAISAARLEQLRRIEPDSAVASGHGLAAHPEPSEEFVQRPPGEWRGMLLNEAWTWPCSEQEPCTNARACVEGRCVACRADDQCLSGEVCVLDHCLEQQATECRSFQDCDEQDALCVLSGTTPGARRGNEQMTSYCQSPTGPSGTESALSSSTSSG